MKCSVCGKPAIVQLRHSKEAYCLQHFINTFEKRVFATINKNKMLKYTDKIGVGVSGGKDSTTVLYLINKLYLKGKAKYPPVAIAINEGINGYREESLVGIRKFCKENDIELKEYSIKDEFGKPVDELIKIAKKKKLALKPCSICGVLRRYMLNKYPRELKLDKLATGHTMDDEIQSFLINLFRGDPLRSARLGPITGIVNTGSFVPRIKPLYFTSERESLMYATLRNFTISQSQCPYAQFAFRNDTRKIIDDLEYKYPGTKFTTIKSSLRFIELAKKNYSGPKKVKTCELCGEPTSKKICQSCELIEKLLA